MEVQMPENNQESSEKKKKRKEKECDSISSIR